MKKWFLLCLTFLISLLGVANTSTYAETEGNEAFIRAIHASPDAPAVDIYITKDKVLENVSFKDVSNYLPLKAGSYNIQIFQEGANANNEKPVIEKSIDVQAGQSYTLAGIGTLNQLDLVVTGDQLQPVEEKAKVRVANLSPDAPSVDIVAVPNTILFENVSFPQVSDYLEVDPGEASIEVRPTGRTGSVYKIPNLELEEGGVYTAIAVGLVEGESALDFILVKDQVR
ncbi:DUF4397 domain-containing protein [Alteribacter populi]|uniref:DUF4397 domain-containing protein n=1 Tax=Alteribacter populi TaxID=2011011 RepID=UPI000BBA49D7|nr:DUF4397 domain-containing protein [Alteribacter populi]